MVENSLFGNATAIIIQVMLLIFIIKNDYFSRQNKKLFLMMTISCFLLSISTFLFTYIAEIDSDKIYLLSFLGSCSRLFYIYPFIAINYLFDTVEKDRVKYNTFLFTYIGFELLSICLAKVFNYDPTNGIYEGNFMSVCFCITFSIFAVSLLVHTNTNHKKNKEYNLAISLIAIIFTTATFVAEICLHTGFIPSLTMSITIVFFYLYFLNVYFKYDHSTGLLNKDSFNSYIANYCRSSYTLAIIDIDNLKQINDKYGHQFGDDCIKDIADILRANFNSQANVYRWGGDEFSIVSISLSKDEVEKLLIKSANQLNKKKLTISYGIFHNDKNFNYEEAIKIADKKCYSMKDQHNKMG